MPDLDLVIRGSTVYDGTGSTGQALEIGIRGDRIAALAPRLSGREYLDAGGLSAAPGFIDTHSHSDLKVLETPTLDPKLRQGITVEVFGQDGISVAPVRSEHIEGRRRQLAGLLTDPDVAWQWRSVAEYLAEVVRARPALDVAYLVPHGALRESVVGMEDRRPTATELQQMCALLAKGIEEGACGLSTGLIYPPCCYSDRDELVALCRTVARHRLPLVAHIRSESDRLLEALEEMFDLGRRSGAHLHVSHLKIAGRNNWSKLPSVTEALLEARRSGLHVTADQYPYVAGSTLMGALLPPWVHAGGSAEAVARLRSPSDRARIRAELFNPSDVDWDNFWKWSGPEGILIADIPSGRHPQWIGRTLAQAASAQSADPIEFAFDLLRDEQMRVAMISFSQSEDVVESLIKTPGVNACTDGLLGGRPHPRAYGTYPRILARFVRERQALSLPAAIRKMTGLAADAFGFVDHGYLQPGKRANVVLFDPESVQDRATYEQPMQFPAGIPHVIVGGKLVIRDSEPTGARPGTVAKVHRS
jgi:N-acyl-D-amino-acid deacylase